MNRVQEEWQNMRICYQQRYVNYLKKFEDKSTPNNALEEIKGHLLECSYVLTTVFGLTSKQVTELEHNYSGMTNDDLKD